MRTSSDETEFPTSTWADDSPSLRVFGLLNLSDRSRPSVLEYVPESPHASWVTTYSQVRAWMPTRLLSIFPNNCYCIFIGITPFPFISLFAICWLFISCCICWIICSVSSVNIAMHCSFLLLHCSLALSLEFVQPFLGCWVAVLKIAVCAVSLELLHWLRYTAINKRGRADGNGLFPRFSVVSATELHAKKIIFACGNAHFSETCHDSSRV